MKKWICAALILSLLLTGCAAPAAEDTTPPTTTVMLYMIGSDLEAQAGAATRDLQEILSSGVDLEHVNVVIYAGGSPHWHNQAADPENHTLLWLRDGGFMEIASVPTSSMGNTGCLANFLTYSYENFPADEYALILWDHGDGPVIGYGKDMLFDNDTLTLSEMRQALDATPFREKKLDWVGFDACLMASAELCAVWADYADYLVASQEVEPAFGWDYRFLSHVGQADTESVLKALTDTYLQSCLSYYDERGYDHRDTTLSCIDLSLTAELTEAVNSLFTAAAQWEDGYNAITSRRVQTRALGRATTGSEYDLIDLQDLAAQFSDLFPEQAARLQQTLQRMIICNATNAQNCCGLSLYYPFYNKYYFEESWGHIYQQLGLFPAYQSYLQQYQTQWLSSDLPVDASSVTPQMQDPGTYTLQLTPEQQDSFACAKYYILVRDGQEYFTRIFVSPHVTNDNGLLTADFDGNVIYVRDELGNYQIPVTIAHDTVDGQSRYSVFVTLTNYSMSHLQIPEGFQTQMQAHRFSLTLDQDTGGVSVSSLAPYDHQSDMPVLAGGKLQETELSQWASCFFLHDDHRYLSRYENGAVMPVDQWPVSTLFSGYEYPIEDGLEFLCAPLAAGDYYLLFEVEDTQGNRYCSELLPIHTEGSLPTVRSADPIHLQWEDPEPLLLMQEQGVSVYLRKITESDGNEAYLLEASNQNDFAVQVLAEDLFCGDVLCDSYFSSLIVEPGQSAAANYGADLGTAHALGMLPSVDQLQLRLSIYNALTGASLIHRQPLDISLCPQVCILPNTVTARYHSFHTPVLGMLAEQQLLLDHEQARVTLLGLGGNGQDEQLRGAVCIENKTALPLSMLPEALVLDDIYLALSGDYGDIPAYSRGYFYFSVPNDYRRISGITTVESARLLLQQQDYSPLFTGNTPKHLYWCPVDLSHSSAPSVFVPARQVLYEENDIRVCLLSAQSKGSVTKWHLTVENDSDRDIALKLADVCLDETPTQPGDVPAHLTHAQLGAGQACVAELAYYYWEEAPAQSITFRFRVMDHGAEQILFTGSKSITLTIP